MATRRKATKKAPPWPYEDDHYLATESLAPRSHHEGEAVAVVQEALNVEATGVFDDATREAVLAYQQENDLPVTGVVDADQWGHLTGGDR